MYQKIAKRAAGRATSGRRPLLEACEDRIRDIKQISYDSAVPFELSVWTSNLSTDFTRKVENEKYQQNIPT